MLLIDFFKTGRRQRKKKAKPVNYIPGEVRQLHASLNIDGLIMRTIARSDAIDHAKEHILRQLQDALRECITYSVDFCPERLQLVVAGRILIGKPKERKCYEN